VAEALARLGEREAQLANAFECRRHRHILTRFRSDAALRELVRSRPRRVTTRRPYC
jgi:hypothetical protein